MWPHALFSQIYNYYRDAFHTRITTGREQLTRFWNSQHGNPQFECEYYRSLATLHTHGIPLTLHGDGVVVTGRSKSWSKCLDVWSWASVLGEGSSCDLMFYIYSLFTSMNPVALGNSSYRRVHARLQYSFTWLQKGRWPTHDCEGVAYEEATGNTRNSLCTQTGQII